MSTVILVTGGTGLVGKAIEHVINTEAPGSKYGKRPDETWIFARSSEADLRRVDLVGRDISQVLNKCPNSRNLLRPSNGILFAEMRNRHESSMRSTSLPMSSISLQSVCFSLVCFECLFISPF